MLKIKLETEENKDSGDIDWILILELGEHWSDRWKLNLTKLEAAGLAERL